MLESQVCQKVLSMIPLVTNSPNPEKLTNNNHNKFLHNMVINKLVKIQCY
jgi:hypothetical protein